MERMTNEQMGERVNESVSRKILHIALPAIVSNVTVPLLGLVDTAIVGHLGAAAYIGAIATGGLIFNVIYWLFGFLRAGTSGFTAQSYGARNRDDVTAHLYRASLLALAVAGLILLLQTPVAYVAFRLIGTTPEVERLGRLYFSICIWGAPATLMLYGFNGWFIGMQSTRTTMVIAIVQNAVNIVVSLLLVFVVGMKVPGVALGTLTAQYAGLAMALYFWKKRFPSCVHLSPNVRLMDPDALKRFFGVNRDIMLRTLCIIAVTFFFTASGARLGERILAANTLLMQLFYLYSFFIDGLANAGEALCGRYHGAGDTLHFRSTVRMLFLWGAVLSVVFSLLYLAGGSAFVHLLTNDGGVAATALHYAGWAVVIPMAGVAAFIWDGIFIGLTATRQMFWSMLIAMLAFFGLYYALSPTMGNNALWLAFVVYLFLRGVAQAMLFPGLLRRAGRGQGAC